MTVIKQESTNAFIYIDPNEKIFEVRDRKGDAQIFYLDDAFKNDLARALAELPMNYTRPELTDEEKALARKDAESTFRKFGLKGMVLALAGLCFENRRLVKEVNEHRAARGIAPLETFEG